MTHIAPETNTEAAQLDADLAEQPHLGTCQCDTCATTHAAADYATAMSRARRLTSPATLLDDVQTLPIFSGTCQRVADPGRFDPPQASTDRQPALF